MARRTAVPAFQVALARRAKQIDAPHLDVLHKSQPALDARHDAVQRALAEEERQ